jgi:hypothetical protein
MTTTKNKSQLTDLEILIKKQGKILVPNGRRKVDIKDHRALALQAEVMRLGFIMDDVLLGNVSKLSDSRIGDLYIDVLSILSKMVGDDVAYQPFYPDFPKQVMEAPDLELFANALFHYWSAGRWRPDFQKSPRLPALEAVKYRTLLLGSESDITPVMTSILGSNASVSDFDKSIVSHLIDKYTEAELIKVLPAQIPFKEQLCAFVAECIQKGSTALGMSSLKTATDVLRVATHLSGGDISLADNTKFKSFGRPLRRALITQLDKVINEDDIARYKTRWVTLAHSLHVGEYSKIAPKAFTILSNARTKGFKFSSFDAKVEAAIAAGDPQVITNLLMTRPGNFARRLDHIMRMFSKQKANDVASAFVSVADKVDTRVLLQLYGHFKTRTTDTTERLIFPKGNTAKGLLLKNTLKAQGKKATKTAMDGIETVLRDRFASSAGMGKVFIDPAMKDCPVPLSLRSASDSLDVVGRGTKFALTDKGTLRLFIYWKGQDIDLSAAAWNEDFSKQWNVSYTNLREAGINSCHSGDIVRAPSGAAEFIDIDIDSALKAGARYVIMQVYVFNGPNFSEHEVCYAGWMTRDKPDKNQIYDPKTVEQKIDVQSKSKTAIPVVFDLKERKAIWLDMVTTGGINHVVNSFETNRASLIDIVKGAMSLDNKPTLFDLFTFHADARGEIVTDIKDADIVFSWDGDVKPTDVNVILSEYLT